MSLQPFDKSEFGTSPGATFKDLVLIGFGISSAKWFSFQ
jgi:hypothetical protein